jgi:hypothetical protein
MLMEVKTMKLIIALLLCVSCGPASWAQSSPETLPASARLMLNRRFPGWKFPEVSQEIQQFFKQEMKGASPVVISGDFDGNGRLDYAALIRRGYSFNNQGQAIGPRHYLIVFLRRNRHYKMHVIKDPDGDYISLAKKGTSDYNYTEQKENTYATDAISTGIFEKGGSSYVYKKGRFISFVSSD